MFISNYPAGVTVQDFIHEECPKCYSGDISGDVYHMVCQQCEYEWGAPEPSDYREDD